MSDENITIPEPAEDALQNELPGYVGQLEENESRLLSSLRSAANQLVSRVGQLEVEKARVLGQLSGIEDRSKALIHEVTQRFGVEGHSWNVHPDGKVFKVEEAPQ
jgi:hypothetical protein